MYETLVSATSAVHLLNCKLVINYKFSLQFYVMCSLGVTNINLVFLSMGLLQSLAAFTLSMLLRTIQRYIVIGKCIISLVTRIIQFLVYLSFPIRIIYRIWIIDAKLPIIFWLKRWTAEILGLHYLLSLSVICYYSNTWFHLISIFLWVNILTPDINMNFSHSEL